MRSCPARNLLRCRFLAKYRITVNACSASAIPALCGTCGVGKGHPLFQKIRNVHVVQPIGCDMPQLDAAVRYSRHVVGQLNSLRHRPRRPERRAPVLETACYDHTRQNREIFPLPRGPKTLATWDSIASNCGRNIAAGRVFFIDLLSYSKQIHSLFAMSNCSYALAMVPLQYSLGKFSANIHWLRGQREQEDEGGFGTALPCQIPKPQKGGKVCQVNTRMRKFTAFFPLLRSRPLVQLPRGITPVVLAPSKKTSSVGVLPVAVTLVGETGPALPKYPLSTSQLRSVFSHRFRSSVSLSAK